MKRKSRKSYPFLVLVLVTSLGFGAFQLVEKIQDQVKEYTAEGRDENKKPAIKKDTDLMEDETKSNSVQDETIEKPSVDTSKTNPTDEKQEEKQEESQEENLEFETVPMEYLEEGTLFIGDSRTSTLYEYAGWDKTDFYVEYGLTIWTAMEDEIVKQKGSGRKISVRQGLSETQYDKIYIMLGINELGRGTPSSYQEQFRDVVNEIRKLQPNAIIFIQSIMHVTDGKDKQGSYINNSEINKRNKKLKKLASQKENVYYIDENEVFDKPGTHKLNPKYTTDGVHIKAQYIDIWRDFILEHGIIK
ncbi:MAG: GDSL-type esterase/lipase family protein [Lachnospiraceae bacterium]